MIKLFLSWIIAISLLLIVMCVLELGVWVVKLLPLFLVILLCVYLYTFFFWNIIFDIYNSFLLLFFCRVFLANPIFCGWDKFLLIECCTIKESVSEYIRGLLGLLILFCMYILAYDVITEAIIVRGCSVLLFRFSANFPYKLFNRSFVILGNFFLFWYMWSMKSCVILCVYLYI
uniref:Uncharacterized protein n=1 Tax=Chrysaora quinquecirrha TaxID=6148 RepID=G8DM01_CHRQI|nr:hypothetical protein [Chrysaora quinquecirrha]ADY15487.1 hypothetical protein [Chrysaora quinquecirrha]